MTTPSATWTALKTRARRCLHRTRQWCRDTWHRITHEPGYAEAVAALLLAANELFVRGEALRRFLTELVHALLTGIRSLLRERPELDQSYGT